jgi:hypothetical protein
MSGIRITFEIQQVDDEGDYIEIGFGASGACSDVEAALYEVQSIIQNEQWETSA